MPTIQIESNLSVEELIEGLSQLDTPTLNQVVASLRKVQLTRENQPTDATMPENEFWALLEKVNWKKNEDEDRLEALWYVAHHDYQQKTGKTYHYIPAVNYESFFNRELGGEKAG